MKTTIEMDLPEHGELWWRKTSDISAEGRYNGLFVYDDGEGRKAMYRCYASAADLGNLTSPRSFTIVDWGRGFKCEDHEVVAGTWFQAAKRDAVPAFLSEQIQKYQWDQLAKLEEEVRMMRTFAADGRKSVGEQHGLKDFLLKAGSGSA